MKVNIGKYLKNGNDRKIKVEIHPHDAFNADSTLAYIILPLLVELKRQKHSSPVVDNEDVPENLRVNDEDKKKYNEDGTTDEKFHDRWNYVLGEMIWAFEQYNIDWEDQYWLEHPKFDLKEYPEDKDQEFIPLRWEKEGKFDKDGYDAHAKRIANGLRLFGKYYQALWT